MLVSTRCHTHTHTHTYIYTSRYFFNMNFEDFRLILIFEKNVVFLSQVYFSIIQRILDTMGDYFYG